MTQGIRLKPHDGKTAGISVVVFWAAIAAIAVAMVVVIVQGTAYGDTLFTAINTTLQDVYSKFLIISTMIGVVAAAICFLMKMCSKSQRVVEESSAWLKRIVIAWAALNALGIIATYFTGVINTGWVSTSNALTKSNELANAAKGTN